MTLPHLKKERGNEWNQNGEDRYEVPQASYDLYMFGKVTRHGSKYMAK